jgi:2-haloacid dehalogenase
VLFVFDVNETLLDLAALDGPFAELTGTPTARREWFDLLIHAALTLTAADTYRDFAELAGECVVAVARAHGRTVSDEQRRAVLGALRSLPAHQDVPGGLASLGKAGHRLVALTNSPLATVRAQLAHAELADLFDDIFSAEQVGALKPAPAAYRLVTDALGVDPADAVLVAAHDWDIAGAQAAGLRTAFLARPGHRQLPATPAPTWTVPDLDALATALRGA